MGDGLLAAEVERYLDRFAATQHASPVLDAMEEHARQAGFPIVGRSVGRFLEVQARAVGARRVVELGSGFGYSAYWFARAGAEVVCSDLSADNRDRAERFLSDAGLWQQVSFHVADAAEVLAGVPGEVDVVFCDADKERYPDHWRAAADRVRVGGVYLADNTLWYGRVATGEPTPDRPGWTEAVVEHNRLVAADPRYASSIVPLRDGVLVALRLT